MWLMWIKWLMQLIIHHVHTVIIAWDNFQSVTARVIMLCLILTPKKTLWNDNVLDLLIVHQHNQNVMMKLFYVRNVQHIWQIDLQDPIMQAMFGHHIFGIYFRTKKFSWYMDQRCGNWFLIVGDIGGLRQ